MVGQLLELQAFSRRNQALGQSQRYAEANKAEAYYWSLQYNGLADWWDREKPLRQRKPRIIVPLFRETIETLHRFVWGGHRRPRLVIAPTLNDGEERPDVGPLLTADEAAHLTSFVGELLDKGKLHAGVREASRKALITSSSALILGARGGYLTAHVEPGKHCTPTWDKEGSLERLEILYQVEREEPAVGGLYHKRWYWYRRVVDAKADTVYKEVPVIAGQEPKWEVDAEKTVVHDLGFCPAHWMRVNPDCSDPIDGTPVIDPSLYPLLDAVNYTVSQRHRAVEYGCDPQLIRKGVPDEARQQLDKSPWAVWDFPNDASVEYAELKLPGAQVATEHLRDLRERFLEACSVVLADPKAVSGNISGVVLEFLHAPMIALASDLRCDVGDCGLAKIAALALRLATVLTQRGQDLWVPGAKKAAAILAGAQLQGRWLDPAITIQWPAWFDTTVQDQEIKIRTANQAVQGGIASRRSAVRYVADVFGVTDPDAEAQELEQEAEEAAKKAAALPLGDEDENEDFESS